MNVSQILVYVRISEEYVDKYRLLRPTSEILICVCGKLHVNYFKSKWNGTGRGEEKKQSSDILHREYM